MHGHNLIAVYPSRSVAENAQARLVNAGVAPSDIRISTEQSGATATTSTSQQEGGFLDWLFGEAPAEHQTWYASNLREGRTALSVYVRGQDHERIRDILEEFDPIDTDEEGLASGQSAYAGSGGAMAQTGSSTDTGATTADAGREQVIPVAKEELEVGKRQTERRHRIRTYVVERPVEEQVRLRDERVTVERRPVSGERAAAADELQEREVEVVERHEEPVVAKKTRPTAEVVVHKEAKDRVETVRDKVRETKVDIDKGGAADNTKLSADRAAAGAKPGVGSEDTGPIPPAGRKG
jgi:stress response protein YsnF